MRRPVSNSAGRRPATSPVTAAASLALIAGTIVVIALVLFFKPWRSGSAADSGSAARVHSGIACFIDTTDSMVLPADPEHGLGPRLDPVYVESIKSLCASQVTFGTQVFLANVSNGSSASRTFSVPPSGDSMPEVLKAREACKRTLAGIDAFFTASLHASVGSSTDLVDALERIPSDGSNGSRPVWRVVFGSDGLVAASRPSGQVNLEKERVTPENVADLVRRSAPLEDLHSLDGASFQFVTPIREPGDRRFANDLGSTRMFWQAWLRRYAPTGSLFNFETSPRPWAGERGCK
jgi:hypothetical protein